MLAAVDHPARGVNEIRGDALAMGDRHQYLARTRRVLDDPDLDGIMATPDVLEELLILSHLERKTKGKGFLDGRVIVGSMNRGGLAGTAFEMDDTFTSMSAARIAELGFDGGKMMYRLDPQDPASGRTIQACAQALNDLARARPARLPGAARRGASRRRATRPPRTRRRWSGSAASRPASASRPLHLWLKVPIVDDLARVCRATTLPLLLLGGPARGTAEETLRDFAGGLAAGARIRGAIIGRNLLYPGDADPLPLSRALTALVHRGASLEDALADAWREPATKGTPAQGRRRPRRPEGPVDDALDVCVLGRVGYDLYAVEQGRPLAEVEHFSRHLGGSSANIAVGLARLGRRVAIISSLGDDALADYLDRVPEEGARGRAARHARGRLRHVALPDRGLAARPLPAGLLSLQARGQPGAGGGGGAGARAAARACS